MNILSMEHINKSYSERELFEDASVFLQDGDKIGIVGINGTGKSTLLRMMAGLEEPDEGNIIRGNHVVISYMPQQPKFTDENATILDCVVHCMLHNARVEAHFSAAYALQTQETTEAEAKKLLLELGFADMSEKVGHLSGGQSKRVALAAVLLAPADILLLDEPTNHLDQEMADWLEGYLRRFKRTMVMITHDRYFLDSVCNTIVELDRGKVYRYETNYQGYLEAKAEREEMEAASERKLRSILRNELKWIRRGAQARSTKQKARIERFESMQAEAATIRRQDAIYGSGTMDSLEGNAPGAGRIGRTTIEINNISKSYGDKCLIRDFSYICLKNDRVAFVGDNGCGKTTLMKMIVGEEQPDAGTITIGQTITMGYYAQVLSHEDGETKDRISYMDPEQRVIDYIRDTAEYCRTRDGLVSASVMLDRFLFPPREQYGKIGKLSGGEKRRLNLLRVLMTSPNVLLLDEPTNDLDVQTLAILEDYLDSFEGIVIAVTHDRYFCDRTMRRVFAFEEGGTLTQYEGGYTDYRRQKQERDAAQGMFADGRQGSCGVPFRGSQAGNDNENEKKPPVYEKQHEKKVKFTFQEQKEYDIIEDEVAALEEQIEGLDCMISDSSNSSDFIKLNQWMQEKAECEQRLEEKMERWVYLQEKAEQIQLQNEKR